MSELQNDSEFFFGYVAKYLDGHLEGDARRQFEALIAQNHYKIKLETFALRRGQLQDTLSQINAPQKTMDAIRRLLQDDETRQMTEMSQIDTLEKKESRFDILKKIALIAVAAGLIAAAVYFFMPTRPKDFPILEYLAYETIAIQEDNGRLNIKTTQDSELKDFIKASPVALNTVVLQDPGFKPVGASLIDYDTKKVMAFFYAQDKNSVVEFITSGNLGMLPTAERARSGNLSYSVYANDRVNFVVFENGKDTLVFLAGQMAAAELVKLAANLH